MEKSEQVLRCPGCAVLIHVPWPEEDEALRFYREDYWTQYKEEQAGLARHNLYTHTLDWIEEFCSPPGTLIDVGCGMGALLALGQKRGWHAIGLDPSASAVAHARAQGLEADEGTWPPSPLPNGGAEVVTFVNVLDHLMNPFAALEEAWRALKPQGLLYVRVPNGPVHVRLAKILGPLGLHHLSVIHRFGFGPSTFFHHLPKMGFEVEAVRTAPPSQGDAYSKGIGDLGAGRAFFKKVDLAAYRISSALGLDKRAWGLSIEVMARKQAQPTAG